MPTDAGRRAAAGAQPATSRRRQPVKRPPASGRARTRPTHPDRRPRARSVRRAQPATTGRPAPGERGEGGGAGGGGGGDENKPLSTGGRGANPPPFPAGAPPAGTLAELSDAEPLVAGGVDGMPSVVVVVGATVVVGPVGGGEPAA